MAIATYILTKYAPFTHTLVIRPEEPTWPTYIYWLYHVLGTVDPVSTMGLFSYFDPNIPDDWHARRIPRERFQKSLALVEKRLGESQFLAGNTFTLADIMVFWCFTTGRVFVP
jgi:glutathione S-transferase